jgi:hypothetical protein
VRSRFLPIAVVVLILAAACTGGGVHGRRRHPHVDTAAGHPIRFDLAVTVAITVAITVAQPHRAAQHGAERPPRREAARAP